jgi:hypothetical protein
MGGYTDPTGPAAARPDVTSDRRAGPTTVDDPEITGDRMSNRHVRGYWR